MTNSTFRHAALIAALLATAGMAQAQTQTPDAKATTPKGESANQYPLGLPEGTRTGMESRSDVKAGAKQAPLNKMGQKGESPNAVLPGQTGGIPMNSTQSSDVKSMNRSEKKAEGRMEAQSKKSIPDQASPGTSPPNYKQ